MKGYCGWNRAPAQQRQQIDRDIPEKHVQQRAVLALDHRENPAGFPIRNLPRTAGSLFRSTRQKSSRRALDDFDAIDWPVSFALLRYDHGPKGSQPGDVPVDMQHFWFEKCCAKQRDRQRSGSHSRPPLSARARVNPNSGGIHHSTLATTNPVE